jgi:hypothetical protein
VQKTILERKGPPTFTCAVEMISKTECRVHHRLDATVDAILAGIHHLPNNGISYFIYNRPIYYLFSYLRWNLTRKSTLLQEDLQYFKSVIAMIIPMIWKSMLHYLK